MRRRHILILAPLLVLPVVLAVLLTGRGTHRGTAAATQISLRLPGDQARRPQTACGVTHNFLAYRAGGKIRFRGAVSARGHYTVALKLKACAAGRFEPAGEVGAKLHDNGTYRGVFTAPTPGYYFVRAELRNGSTVLARSSKRYFNLR